MSTLTQRLRSLLRAYLALPRLHTGPIFTPADYCYLAVFALSLLALAMGRP